MTSCIIKNTKNKNQMIRSDYDLKYNQTFSTIKPSTPPPQNTTPYIDHYNNFRNKSSAVPQRHTGLTPIFTEPHLLHTNKHAIYHKFTNII